MKNESKVVNLSQTPGMRWELTSAQISGAKELIASYFSDLGGPELLSEFSIDEVSSFIRNEHLIEMESIASQIQIPLQHVVLTNIYYDIFKGVMGCSAFACNTPSGPIHARNLDWWTENNMLDELTEAHHFHGKNPDMNFSTISWPGYVAALSGMAHGRFSISLNAVLSGEPFRFAKPVSMLIREVLEFAKDYDEALEVLSTTEIMSDCLLLLSGIKKDQLCLIERTPTKSATISPGNDFIAVTNHYQKLEEASSANTNILQETACARHEKLAELLNKGTPDNKEQCFSILNNPSIKMNITVQQMFFKSKTSEIFSN